MAEFEPGYLLLGLLSLFAFSFVGGFLCLCSLMFLLLQHERENKRERSKKPLQLYENSHNSQEFLGACN